MCMDSKGPPRRGEDCAGAFREAAQWSRSRGNSRKGVGSIPALAFISHAPVAQSVEPVHVPLWVTTGGCGWVAGSNPAGRNFLFSGVGSTSSDLPVRPSAKNGTGRQVVFCAAFREVTK